MSNDLFRKESIDFQGVKWAGNVILNTPITLKFLVMVSSLISILILLFIIFGSYTKRITVQGQLVPKNGIIKIYAPSQGYVEKLNISEGQYIEENGILATINNSKNISNGSFYDDLDKNNKSREVLLDNEIMKVKLIHENEIQQINNTIKNLNDVISKNENLIRNQIIKLNFSKKTLNRYQDLLKENAVSHEDVSSKEIIYINEFSNLEALKNENLNYKLQLKDNEIDLKKSYISHQSQISQLQRSKLLDQQDSLEKKLNHQHVLKATKSGYISTINYNEGQTVELNRPLVTIMPDNDPLIAQLYLPSSAIGFIEVNNEVLMRYKAYSYQKFKHGKGKVKFISKTALIAEDFNSSGIGTSQEALKNEPLYLVKVELQNQSIQAYGKNIPLQSGMLLEADIMQETRNLYEWVLEPIFSITGKF